MTQKEQSIAILGTQNPVGRAILSELERQGTPAYLIHPLDLHQDSGAKIPYQNHTLISSALDLFDLTEPHILFLCEPRIFERYPHHFLHNENWLIDCTGRIEKACCIIPEINGNKIPKLSHKALCAPNSASIALARCLRPLHNAFSLVQTQAVAILGAWYPQPNLVRTLEQQTRHYFTQTPLPQPEAYPPLAFNLIPNFFKSLMNVITRELNCFLPVPVLLDTCFAPVVRGGVFFIRAQTKKRLTEKKIRALFGENTACRFLDSDMPIGTHDLLAEDKLFIQDLQVQDNVVTFWLMQDPLQTGFIQNAVQILPLLQK